MTDETNEQGTSADAEVPNEEQQETIEAEAETPSEEPTAEAESVTEEPTAEEPAAEEPAAAAETAVAVPAKPKKRRLPRALRPQRTRPAREKPKERRPIVRLPKPEHVRGRSQERQGTVVSAAADKTIVVRVDVVKMHPRYKKVIRRSTKFHAHDERNEAKVGDIVRIVETRPLSRMKRWRLQEIVEAAK